MEVIFVLFPFLNMSAFQTMPAQPVQTEDVQATKNPEALVQEIIEDLAIIEQYAECRQNYFDLFGIDFALSHRSTTERRETITIPRELPEEQVEALRCDNERKWIRQRIQEITTAIQNVSVTIEKLQAIRESLQRCMFQVGRMRNVADAPGGSYHEDFETGRERMQHMIQILRNQATSAVAA